MVTAWVGVIALDGFFEELHDAIATYAGMAGGQGIAPTHYRFLLLVICARCKDGKEQNRPP